MELDTCSTPVMGCHTLECPECPVSNVWFQVSGFKCLGSNCPGSNVWVQMYGFKCVGKKCVGIKCLESNVVILMSRGQMSRNQVSGSPVMVTVLATVPAVHKWIPMSYMQFWCKQLFSEKCLLKYFVVFS